MRPLLVVALVAAAPALAQPPEGDGAARAFDQVTLESGAVEVRIVEPPAQTLGQIIEAVSH